MDRTTMTGKRTALLALVSTLVRTACAALVSHDFDIGWVTANPDGAFNRPTIGINGQWPVPRIDANVGDTVLINVRNNLGNQSTSLHFHGLYMNGSTHMDGPAQVSQCAIPPGSSFTYNFTINQPGTYWYHSHTQSQYPDGIRGPLIVHDPDSPFKDRYDQEIVVSLSDWYHDQMADLIPAFMGKGNPTGAEPVPQAALMNDTQNLTVAVQPGKTYLFRMVNMAAFAGQYVWIEGHNISIVEVDGIYTEPAEATMIYISAAQRYSFLVTTRNDTASNFAIVGSMDTSLFDKLPEGLNYNVTGWLVYDPSKPLDPPATLDTFTPFDDMTLVPQDRQPRLPAPSKTIELDVIMENLGDGGNYAFFNNITYKAPKVPTLYTALSAGDAAAVSPEIYGAYTHSFVLDRGDVVQVVVNNLDPGRHPFHLHGHDFQALYRAPEEGGTFADANLTEADFPAVPMRRDTLVVWPNGNIVLRFRANNPGVWLFHCHIEWHVTSGLIATFVEAPLDLQRTLLIPQNHLDVCAAANVPTAGNAAGNTKNFLDLSGQNTPPARLPDGFTARGIVALVFSCLTGILGVLVVGWYGLAKVEEHPSAVGYADQTSDTVAAAEGHTGDARHKEPPIVESVSGGSGTGQA
ncbi:Putative multicopper oxidase, second cupredoxin domain, multicopper oxidase, copper-binding protein [Colletotrichum destructivum]|uniref:Multicopper oxidase, second cupredoxin domain, multicopper oxidase, copper-binding protein n=1 Tax=Colletotrichum destructivum TaxID=34406 RepID=A0AAX4IE40_9PEZI|nr:Putative multicopper oxidase, second cupredoxin domain, multicopper oxidase, copper-binding protein [Colletotrichum destructivum]